MVDAVLDDFGFVDLLVANAGIASRGNTVADTDPGEVERLLATHAVSAHHLARLVLPSMRQRTRGDIVMISSVATSHMAANGAPYNMAKAALEALAFTLAKEERAHGIHVNVVAPGLVETDMGVRLARAVTGDRSLEDLRSLDAGSPFGRVCQPADIAEVVLWLCSERRRLRHRPAHRGRRRRHQVKRRFLHLNSGGQDPRSQMQVRRVSAGGSLKA